MTDIKHTVRLDPDRHDTTQARLLEAAGWATAHGDRSTSNSLSVRGLELAIAEVYARYPGAPGEADLEGVELIELDDGERVIRCGGAARRFAGDEADA